jgi:hypothetical protein
VCQQLADTNRGLRGQQQHAREFSVCVAVSASCCGSKHASLGMCICHNSCCGEHSTSSQQASI